MDFLLTELTAVSAQSVQEPATLWNHRQIDKFRAIVIGRSEGDEIAADIVMVDGL